MSGVDRLRAAGDELAHYAIICGDLVRDCELDIGEGGLEALHELHKAFVALEGLPSRDEYHFHVVSDIL